MNTQTNESPVDDRFANVAVELDELIERGEISREAFAVGGASGSFEEGVPQAEKPSECRESALPSALPGSHSHGAQPPEHR